MGWFPPTLVGALRRRDIQHNGIQHNDTQHIRHTAQQNCHAECRFLLIVMLNVVMLNVVLLIVVAPLSDLLPVNKVY